MIRKAFTVDEANVLIPQLEKVLERLRRCATMVEASHEKLQLLDVLWGPSVRQTTNPDYSEFTEAQSTMRSAARELEMVIHAEIAGRGIRFPQGGLELGLLDFPTTWQGRWVFLCWRSGERCITAWHEIDGGYAGRQPLTADQAKRMGREDDPAHVDDSMLDF